MPRNIRENGEEYVAHQTQKRGRRRRQHGGQPGRRHQEVHAPGSGQYRFAQQWRSPRSRRRGGHDENIDLPLTPPSSPPASHTRSQRRGNRRQQPQRRDLARGGSNRQDSPQGHEIDQTRRANMQLKRDLHKLFKNAEDTIVSWAEAVDAQDWRPEPMDWQPERAISVHIFRDIRDLAGGPLLQAEGWNEVAGLGHPNNQADGFFWPTRRQDWATTTTRVGEIGIGAHGTGTGRELTEADFLDLGIGPDC